MAVEKKGREKITLQEIADRVGVSRNTVSKILNDRYTGSSEIKDRVLRMLQETNYRESEACPEKKSGRSEIFCCFRGKR